MEFKEYKKKCKAEYKVHEKEEAKKQTFLMVLVVIMAVIGFIFLVAIERGIGLVLCIVAAVIFEFQKKLYKGSTLGKTLSLHKKSMRYQSIPGSYKGSLLYPDPIKDGAFNGEDKLESPAPAKEPVSSMQSLKPEPKVEPAKPETVAASVKPVAKPVKPIVEPVKPVVESVKPEPVIASIKQPKPVATPVPEEPTAFEIRGSELVKYNEELGGEDVVIPDTVDVIGVSAFEKCNRIKSVVIPGNVINIKAQAFKGCDALTKVVMEEGVAEIGDEAFSGCRNLNELTIPASVKAIGKNAFARTGEVKVAEDNEKYYSAEGAICSRSENTLLFAPNSAVEFTVPGGIKVIGSNAFAGCIDLVLVTIPDEVEAIEEEAFYDCEMLTEISLPKKLKNLSETAFKNCSSLETVIVAAKMAEVAKTACPGAQIVTYEQMGLIVEEDPVDISAQADASNYFKGCSTLEELENRYQDLKKVFHPANAGGNADTMQSIQNEYEGLKQLG